MANGTFGGGTGTKSDPYRVEDALDLDAIRNNLTASYRIMNDIDCSSLTNFIPIGTDTSFTGNFFGDGKTIRNLTVNVPGRAGLFAYVSTPATGLSFVDITFENCSFTSTESDAGCIGLLSLAVDDTYYQYRTFGNIRVKNCTIKGYRYVGGVVGHLYPSFATVNNIGVDAYIEGLGDYTGGVYGYVSDSNAYYSNHYDYKVSGTVKGRGKYTGGINGWGDGNTYYRRMIVDADIYGGEIVSGMVNSKGGSTMSGSYIVNRVQNSYQLTQNFYTSTSSGAQGYRINCDQQGDSDTNRHLDTATLTTGSGW